MQHKGFGGRIRLPLNRDRGFQGRAQIKPLAFQHDIAFAAREKAISAAKADAAEGDAE